MLILMFGIKQNIPDQAFQDAGMMNKMRLERANLQEEIHMLIAYRDLLLQNVSTSSVMCITNDKRIGRNQKQNIQN